MCNFPTTASQVFPSRSARPLAFNITFGKLLLEILHIWEVAPWEIFTWEENAFGEYLWVNT